jgi:acetyl esterase/lipase
MRRIRELRTIPLWVVSVAIVLACPFQSAQAQEPIELTLWPEGPPGGIQSTMQEEVVERTVPEGSGALRDRSLKGVTTATLSVYLPVKGSQTRAVVLICPGGGFTHLAIDKEGHDIARWLVENQFAGVVLKYRLPDPEAGLYVTNGARLDMQRALRLIRHHAAEWNLDAARVGVMGFSAGGYLAALAGVDFDPGDSASPDPVARQSCRPDFIAPIYPLVSLTEHVKVSPDRVARMVGPQPTPELVAKYSPETQVSAASPPAFIVHAHDDRLSSENSVAFYLALHAAGVPAELHVYAAGGHGFGIRKDELPVAGWPQRWLEWFASTIAPQSP